MNDRPLTPIDVEVKLHGNSQDLDSVYKDLEEAEYSYYTTKAALEIGRAQSFLDVAGSFDGRHGKITVADKEAIVVDRCADLIRDHYVAQAKVNAARKNFERIKTQIEITRSQSSIIRTSMEMA